MKKLFILLTSIFAVSMLAMAQLKLYVHQNDGSYTEFIAAAVDSITFSEQTPEKDVANGYEYVDLGLTSGALWATCNLGADKPEEYGDYFAWGELKHKYRYEMNNYVGNASGKYDVYNILELADDVVYKRMGGAWHIPSPAEINELKDECEWTWTSINNVNGYEVKGPNGNTIFLPVAGVFYETLDNVGKGGIYRANAKIGKTTFNLYLDEKYGVRAFYENEAHPGHSIRPVCHKINEKYTLTFSANGGEGEMESMSLKYGEHRILPEVSFTRENHAYTTWNTKADGTGTSYNNKSQISITEDIVLYAQWREIKLIDGYEYIDLGLPSGLLWANQNIGAEKPEDYGDYFAWGEVEPLDENYKWREDSKYGDRCSEVGFELIDDAARQIWGGNWRVPLPEEIEELIAECEWTWTVLNNVNGYEVKGPNGNSIFLPAAGSFGIYGPNEDIYFSQGVRGYYRGNLKRCQSYTTILSSSQISAFVEMHQEEGYSIRPVRNKTTETYTLTFDANGGEGEMDGLTLENSEYKILPGSTFTKEGYVFASWNTKADGTGTTYKDKSQITLKDNTTLYAQWIEYVSSEGNEYVDLGLSVKWATHNLGAEKPEDFGNNYAWGEVETKDTYDWSNYKWCNGGEPISYSSKKLTKYCTTSSYGNVDNKTTLEIADDAANANLGGNWRMPTSAEVDELISECEWIWQEGGYLVVSKVNSKSIFIPSASVCAKYWTSDYSGYKDSYILYVSPSNYYKTDNSREKGLLIRPVLP